MLRNIKRAHTRISIWRTSFTMLFRKDSACLRELGRQYLVRSCKILAGFEANASWRVRFKADKPDIRAQPLMLTIRITQTIFKIVRYYHYLIENENR
ncbi:hypothetical protein BpHYR1_018344 [Brachionus plicatilis]|uniref:Uncharacterized protein n=1 Tax=Brachionus plicatilis TaxID=10195 RepID=A0A3M7RA91_BRAPC|nr:hypothetical protein BpHYR1_018344 [Brachionus plicatilis]